MQQSFKQGRIIGFIPFPKVLVRREMQLAWSRIWTRFAMSISYEVNHYTMGTSIIIFMWRSSHGFPWRSLGIPLYHPSLPIGLPCCILYQNRVIDRFSLVVQPLLVRAKVSTRVHRVWVRLYFFTSVPHARFV